MRTAILACLAASVSAAPAQALCFYRKEDYFSGKSRSHTSIPQEFRDSKWVVRARLEDSDNHWSNNGDSWTVYTVRIIRRYKGPAARTLRVFTFRDSDGFYLDKGRSPDLNNDYLLFLVAPRQALPRGVRDVTQVNFSCGQSSSLDKISVANLKLLDRLAVSH